MRDWTRTPTGFVDCKPIEKRQYDQLRIRHSHEDGGWTLEAHIAFSLIEEILGVELDFTHRWECNFYKCGDETPFPHWGAWSEVSQLNFHLPQCFGYLQFDK
jgi:hypothetical protein